MADNFLQKVNDLVVPIMTEMGYELLASEKVVEFGRPVIRLYIDKPGGVGIEDCAKVSHAVEDVMEVEGVFNGRFVLEVSSPGLNRPLVVRDHFVAVIGKTVNVLAKEKINGRKRFVGILKAVGETALVICIDGGDFEVPLSQLAKSHLVGDLGT